MSVLGEDAPAGLAPALWQRLREQVRVRASGAEPAHDFFHVERVVGNALEIVRVEGGNEPVVAVAALLHELFNLPKSHPESWRSGDLCAEHARTLLLEEQAPSELVDPVCAAIRDHAFSKGVVPEALESRILQDADRLDALGAIGLARMWATCADMKRPFYSPEDPFATARTPDDKSWGLDHVYKKLLLVPDRLHLPTSRSIAAERAAFIRDFVDQLRTEIAPASAPKSAPPPSMKRTALSRIIDEAPDGIVVSRDGTVLWANRAAARLLAHESPSSLVGQSTATFLEAESLVTASRRIEELQDGGAAAPREYPVVRKDGVRMTAEVVSTIIDWEGGPAALSFVRDATERARLRARLAHVDRLAAIGTIAAGVAHEINNPLGFMRLSTEVFERELSQLNVSPELVTLARDMRAGIDRITAVVRDLRFFGRYEDVANGTVERSGALDGALRLVNHEIAPRVNLRREHGELPPVIGTQASLEQVFVHALLHSAFAFTEQDRGEIAVRSETSDAMLTIDLVDDGPGLEASVLERLFDPFAVPVTPERTSGLGLLVCREIVERLGGSLSVASSTRAESADARGTTIRITLPRAVPRRSD